MNQGGAIPMSEMFGTFALSVGAAVSSQTISKFSLQTHTQFVWIQWIFVYQVGMEFWARWAHRALWHASLWNMHEVSYLFFFFFERKGWLPSILILTDYSISSYLIWFFSIFFGEQSHHKPREGPFELNDVFAIINAVPAISLLSYGFFNKGLVPGLCFGAVYHLSLSLYRQTHLSIYSHKQLC